MKVWTITGTALVVMSAVGVAMAQAPAASPVAPPPPGGPAMQGPPPRGPMGGPPGPMGGPMGGPPGPMEEHGGFGWRHGRMEEMHHMPPPPPSKAAHFRLRKDGASIDIKCADDEPMKACVDAASVLLDKAAAQK